MCHAHTFHHTCGHQSVTWLYCPSSTVDLETGTETACEKKSFAPSQLSSAQCPLQNCMFKTYGGLWICCQCQQGPNTKGWCTYPRLTWVQDPQSEMWSLSQTCDHGCCKNCCKFHPPQEEAEATKASGSGSGSGPESGSGSKRGPYDIQLDYGPPAKKSSRKNKSSPKKGSK